MRALVLAVLCPGCVIPPPDGVHQYWPPALGLAVESVVAADLDGNGSTEIVVFGAGAENQAGMYFLDGDEDLVYASGFVNPVRTFSRFVPASFTRPLGATLVDDGSPAIVVAHSEPEVAVSRIASTLAITDRGDTAIAGGSARLWTRPLALRGATHIAVSNGSSIEVLSNELADPWPIPDPDGSGWNEAQLVTSYATDSEPIIVVATTDRVVRARLPEQPGQPLRWEGVRSGPAWLGQTPFDFDGDGREEIVGFDLANRELCVVDPGATPPAAPSCVRLLSAATGTDVTLIIGHNLSMNVGLDVLIAQASGSATSFTLVEDYTYNAGTLSVAMVRALPTGGPARSRTVIARETPAAPYVGLSFGTDGGVACIFGPC